MVALAASVSVVADATALNARSGHPTCAIGRTGLRLGPLWSEATGQNTVIVVLTNRLAHPCEINGYPTIALYDGRGRRLHFTYRHSGDQMITARKPRPVLLRPGSRAYFAFNKYRCDMGGIAAAETVQVALPRSGATRSLHLRSRPSIDFCRPGIPIASVVAVSPIVPRLGDIAARH